MANLSKIKVGDTSYNIVPQLGTALAEEEGVVKLCIGGGITFNKNNELAPNIGSGLVLENTTAKIVVSLGTAVVAGDSEANCGISITDGNFQISSADFCNYLKSLGVLFA